MDDIIVLTVTLGGYVLDALNQQTSYLHLLTYYTYQQRGVGARPFVSTTTTPESRVELLRLSR